MELQVDPADGKLNIVFTLQPDIIAATITFENSHLVAQHLTSNPEVARALYEELSYWADNNQI
jgi:hypothetical protein